MGPIRDIAHEVLRGAHAEAVDIAHECNRDARNVAPMAAHVALDVAHEVARQVAPLLTDPRARKAVEQAQKLLRLAVETDAQARGWPNDLDLLR